MIVFLKRLVGREESQIRERERFTNNLNGFDAKQEKLSEIEDQLNQILTSVAEQEAHIRTRPGSAMSGQHILNLPCGGSVGKDSGT